MIVQVPTHVKYFEKIVGNKIKIKIEKERYRNKNAEVFRLLGSNKKIKKYSNWKPKYVGKKGFYLALEKTYYWYKKNLKKIQNVDDLFL